EAVQHCGRASPVVGTRGCRPCVRACEPGAGRVDDPKQCGADAAQAYVACGKGCLEDFQFAKDTCRNKDHDCVETCREERGTCEQPIRDALDQAVAQCQTDKKAAVLLCAPDATHCTMAPLTVPFQYPHQPPH